MKQNGNNEKIKEYYIGLDVGTNSCGWAVTDPEYNVLRFKGKSMWGARLFDEAQTAAGRRTARTARRRLARRRFRLDLLESFFEKEITNIDPLFFRRLKNSNLYEDEIKAETGAYSLFNDKGYTDREYLKEYPTIYHLRSELIHSTEPHDVRLVFLALHHLLKKRGHFLYDTGDNDNFKNIDTALDDLQQYLDENGIPFEIQNKEEFKHALMSRMKLSEKKKKLKEVYGSIIDAEESDIDVAELIDSLSGAVIKLSKLFCDETLKETEINSLSLGDDLDEKYDALSAALAERLDLILLLKNIFDSARLSILLDNKNYICDAKKALYEKNKNDLKLLKSYIRRTNKSAYRKAFYPKEKTNNFAAYTRYKTEYQCNQEDFLKFLEKEYFKGKEELLTPEENRMYEEIKAGTFLTKLKGSENGLIPYQLAYKEVKKILENASAYLPFLKEAQVDGLTTAEKIERTFTFRIPYYVGPLNKKAKHSFIARTDEKIYPWNFERVVDLDASAGNFMASLIGRCTYTNEPVLPLNSLLYSQFAVLNEINRISVNDEVIPVEIKRAIYQDLFVKSGRNVTKKQIFRYLKQRGLISDTDKLSGIDDNVKAKLKSLHDFQSILENGLTKDNREMVEKIIEAVLVYSDDKKMLKRWLEKNIKELSDEEIKKICRLNYRGWGRLSKTFLQNIYHVDKNGEAHSIIDMLWETNENLMRLMSDAYSFQQKCMNYKKEHFDSGESIRKQLDDLYIAPAVRRSIWQTLRVVDEVVDIQKGAPAKIMIEMARPSKKDTKKQRTISRKEKLIALYKACDKQKDELFGRLNQETDESLRRNKLYLYYTQFGKCMYSGEKIDLTEAMKDDETYDIDHIFPRSRIVDDSIENRVLVKSKLNRDKSNVYPIAEEIRQKMQPFWEMLHSKKLMSDTKYNRLIRHTPLTDEELSSFITRQLVETSQSTKALATLLQQLYPNTKIIYSKAKNVSNFRRKYKDHGLIKSREINDLHHAKDAYLNIVVGNTFATKFTDRFFMHIHENAAKNSYSLTKIFDHDTKGAWKSDGTSLKTVEKYMNKNNPIVTFASICVKGELYDQQPRPKAKKDGSLFPLKKDMPVEKYGGYKNLTGSYFYIVEHTKGKKTLTTILPVYLYNVAEYERDPIAYSRQIHGLVNPKIIVKKLPKNSILEFDGMRLLITGRTGPNNLYMHNYQFAVDKTHAEYIRNIKKYVTRYETKKPPVVVSAYDKISAKGNIDLYDWLCERMRMNPYKQLFEGLIEDLETGREKFGALDVLGQSKIILEILKSFKCDRQMTNIKELNGKGTAGKIQKTSNISICQKVNVIIQSVTGLYEYKRKILG